MDSLKKQIFEDVESMHIAPDDTLLVHSSFKSLGAPRLSASSFLQTLVDYLHQGTLLFPSLSYKFVSPQNPCFDNRKTASCVGFLPEVFRTQFDVIRSNHPTHSVCALGKEAHSITHLHAKDQTPCGQHSPFTLLPKYNGKILMLGCGLKPNTFMHSVEEFVEPPYLFGPKLNYSLVDEKGNFYEKEYVTHAFENHAQRYDRVLQMEHTEFLTEASLLQAKCYVLDSAKLKEHALRKLNQDEFFFVDKMETHAD